VKVSRFASLALLPAMLLVACSRAAPAAPATPTPEVSGQFVFGVVLVGAQDDHGWSEAHYAGGRYVEAHLPDTRMVVLDSLNPDARPTMTLEQGVDAMVEVNSRVIFVTSDDFAADTLLVAQKYPDTTFIHISGDQVLSGEAPANLGNYMGRMEYGKMIAGCAAALATQTSTIAYLGPLVNNETQRLANSVYLGARYCYEHMRGEDPDQLHFLIQFIGFWFNIPEVTLDPTAVSNQLLDAGADVLLSGIDTTEALAVAAKRAAGGEQVWAIPYDYEGACSQGPEVCLGVPYFNWGPGYLEMVQEVRDGNWTQRWDWVGPDWADMNNHDTSAVGFRKGPALTSVQSEQLDTFVAGLADGSIVLFRGPLNYQDGTPFLADGQTATDTQVWYTEQLLQGMETLSE
jgi:simple sugar transport system substrate-binding protein